MALTEADLKSIWPKGDATQRTRSKGKQSRRVQDEQARVDAAMELLETAKQQAKQQKDEYGKYLKRKVKMQRKEQKQRQQEEDYQRERVEQKLNEVLREHRQSKQQHARSFYNPVPPRKIASPAPILEYSGQTNLLRLVKRPKDPMEPLSYHAAAHAEEPPEPSLQAPPPRIRKAQVSGVVENRGNPFDALREDITFEDVIRLPVLEKQVASLRALQALESPPTPPKSPQTYFGKQVGGRVRRYQLRLMKVEAMLQKARQRREHAAEVMTADPPADYLPENMLAMVWEGMETKDDDLMFMTEVDVPETTIGTSANRKPRIGRRGRYVHYNPLVDSMALVSPPKAPAEDLEDEDLDDPNVQAKLQQERQEQYYTLQHYIEGIEERAKPRGAQLPDVPLQGAAVAAKIAVAESPQGPIAKPKWNVDVDLDQVVLDVPPNDRMDEL